MTLSVGDVMTRRVVTVRGGQWLTEAAILMKTDDLDALPVVSDDRVIGIITHRDIVIRVIAEGRDPHAVRAEEVASHLLVTVRPGDKVDEALRLMKEHEVGQLPVVEDSRLVGVISRADANAGLNREAVQHGGSTSRNA